jgi:hypothetical protein
VILHDNICIPGEAINFVTSSNNAPTASDRFLEPINKPNTIRGGNRATATITPIRDMEAPLVKASTPALPEANHRLVFDQFSGIVAVGFRDDDFQ